MFIDLYIYVTSLTFIGAFIYLLISQVICQLHMLSNLIFIRYSILSYPILSYPILFLTILVCFMTYLFAMLLWPSFMPLSHGWLFRPDLWIRTVAKRGALQQKWSKTPLSAISLLTHTDQPPDRCYQGVLYRTDSFAQTHRKVKSIYIPMCRLLVWCLKKTN